MSDRRTRSAIVAGAFGLVLGVSLFAMTSVTPGWGGVGPCLGPEGAPVEVAWEHFDPWTGQPRPRTYLCDADGAGPIAAQEYQYDVLEGAAIPVPVGAALGFGITWLLLASRRRTNGVTAMQGAGSP